MAQQDQSIELATIALPDLKARLNGLDVDRIGQLMLASEELDARNAAFKGHMLLAVKERLAHGEWLGWLKRYWSKSVRSAQVYIRLADEGKYAAAAYLPGATIKDAEKAIRKPRAKKAAPAPVIVDVPAPKPQIVKPGERCPACGEVKSAPTAPQRAPVSPASTSTDAWHGPVPKTFSARKAGKA